MRTWRVDCARLGQVTSTIRVGSAGLNVSDLDRSVRFYREALGFAVVRRGDDAGHSWAHLGLEDDVMLTLWEQAVSHVDHGAAGLHHISFELASVAALVEAEARLRAMGAHLREDGPQAPGGQVFCRDPDGIRVELYTEEPTPPAPAGSLPRCGFYEELDVR